jgi:hypothetical protein
MVGVQHMLYWTTGILAYQRKLLYYGGHGETCLNLQPSGHRVIDCVQIP